MLYRCLKISSQLFASLLLSGSWFFTSLASMAMDNSNNDELLIIGCRPWDENMKGFSALYTAHFVDFRNFGAPEPTPNSFHLLDLNDQGEDDRKFSVWAAANPSKYKIVIIDFGTEHHIRRDGAWADLASLLRPGGKLIIPVNVFRFGQGDISRQQAEKIRETKLAHNFSQIELCDFKDLPLDQSFDLLRRPNLEPGRLESMAAAVVIIATKQAY